MFAYPLGSKIKIMWTYAYRSFIQPVDHGSKDVPCPCIEIDVMGSMDCSDHSSSILFLQLPETHG